MSEAAGHDQVVGAADHDGPPGDLPHDCPARPGYGCAGPDPPAGTYDQTSLCTPTGGGVGSPARSAAERWPCANAGELTHAWNASSSRQRVTTSQVVRSSFGRSNSKPSN